MKKGKYLATFWQDSSILFLQHLSLFCWWISLLSFNWLLFRNKIWSSYIYLYNKILYDSLLSFELPNCRQPSYLCALCALANDIWWEKSISQNECSSRFAVLVKQRLTTRIKSSPSKQTISAPITKVISSTKISIQIIRPIL